MPGCIDWPSVGWPFIAGEHLQIRGWLTGICDSISVLINGRELTRVPRSVKRPDVRRAIKTPDDLVGFEASITLPQTIGPQKIQVGRLLNGQNHIELEQQVFIHARRALPPPFYIITHERSGTHFLINTLFKNAILHKPYLNVGEWPGPFNSEGRSRQFAHIDAIAKDWERVQARVSVLKSHADHDLYQARYPQAKCIYVLRDPRDTLASFFYYLNSETLYRNNPDMADHRCRSFSRYLRRPLSPSLRWNYSVNDAAVDVADRWARHVRSWQDAPHCLTVRFEELKLDYVGVLCRVAAFLNLELITPLRPVGLFEGESMLPRKGVIGDWQSLFTPEDNAYVRAAIERHGLVWDKVIWR